MYAPFDSNSITQDKMSYYRKYIDLSPEQIAAAQHADIAEYLLSRGEKLIYEGNHALWKKHDSCVISGYI